MPVNVNEVFEVILSLLDGPESDIEERSGVVGAVKTYRITATPEPPFPPLVL